MLIYFQASGFNHQGVLINWGPERTVEIKREKDETKFGLSIFGKHICNSTYGIFIGNVNSHSPAGRTGQLFAGDKINQIGNQAIDSDIKVAHDALDNAGDTIQLIVQSVQKVMVNIMLQFSDYILFVLANCFVGS